MSQHFNNGFFLQKVKTSGNASEPQLITYFYFGALGARVNYLPLPTLAGLTKTALKGIVNHFRE